MHLQNLLNQINELVVLELQKYLTDRNYNVHNCFFLLFPKCHFFQNCFRTNSAPTINTKTSRNMCSIGIKPANSPSIIFINLLRNNFEFEPLSTGNSPNPRNSTHAPGQQNLKKIIFSSLINQLTVIVRPRLF